MLAQHSISRFRVIESDPKMTATEIVFQAMVAMIGLSAIWVFLDARQRGLGEPAAGRGWLSRIKPASWAALTLFVWVGVFFPLYLIVRRGHPVITERKDWTATLLGWLVLGCAVVMVSAAAGVGTDGVLALSRL